MSSQGQVLSPVEVALENGNVNEIKNILDYRWKHGWRLDRIIEHINVSAFSRRIFFNTLVQNPNVTIWKEGLDEHYVCGS